MKRIINVAKRDINKVTVNICMSDPSTFAGAERVLYEAIRLGPIGGIFHSAVVLNDALIEDQTGETFRKVCAPKVDALHNLDVLTRKVCPNIDYFVAFSSQVSCRGFVGQNNYGYANSAMERICENRRRDGLNGLAILYGAIGDVGLWAQNENIDLTEIGMVIITQRIQSCLHVLDTFLQTSHPVLSTIVRLDVSQQTGED